MQLLAEIERRQGLRKEGKTIYREAVRGIIRRNRDLLMVYSPKNGDYKFPGGGVDGAETYAEALVREIREECGATVTRIQGAFGKVIEYDLPEEQDYQLFKMASLYYFCDVDPCFSEQQLDSYEKDLDFQPIWIDIDTVIAVNSSILQCEDPHPPRWTRRDTFVLERIREQMSKESLQQPWIFDDLREEK